MKQLHPRIPTKMTISPPSFPSLKDPSTVVADPFLVQSLSEKAPFDAYILCEIEYASKKKTIGALGWRPNEDKPVWLGDILDNSALGLGHSFPYVITRGQQVYLVPETTPAPLSNSSGPTFWESSPVQFPFCWQSRGPLWTRGSNHEGRITDLALTWVPEESKFLVVYNSGTTVRNRLNVGWIDRLGGTFSVVKIATPHEFPAPGLRSRFYRWLYFVWKFSSHRLPNLGQNRMMVAGLRVLLDKTKTLPSRPAGSVVQVAPRVFRVLLQGQDTSKSWDIRESYGSYVEEFELRLDNSDSTSASLRTLGVRFEGSNVSGSFDEFKVHTRSNLTTEMFEYVAYDGFGVLENGERGWSVHVERSCKQSAES